LLQKLRSASEYILENLLVLVIPSAGFLPVLISPSDWCWTPPLPVLISPSAGADLPLRLVLDSPSYISKTF
jgi:hypothetical protein